MSTGTDRTLADLAILRDVRDRLAATKLFGEVVLGASPGQVEIPPDLDPVAYVARSGWRDEEPTSDGEDRELAFGVWIHVREGDPEQRFAKAVELEAAVLAEVGGKRLGDVTMPGETRADRASEDRRPEQKATLVQLTCRASYQRIG